MEIFNRELGDYRGVQGPEKILDHQSLYHGDYDGLGELIFGEQIIEIEKWSCLESVKGLFRVGLHDYFFHEEIQDLTQAGMVV